MPPPALTACFNPEISRNFGLDEGLGKSRDTYPISTTAKQANQVCVSGLPLRVRDAYTRARALNYSLRMNATTRLACAAILLGLTVSAMTLLAVSEPISAGAQVDPHAVSQAAPQEPSAETLAEIVGRIPSIPEETRLRRSLAQATFCLPQNLLGVLYYALNEVTGSVLCTQEMNETTVVVTRLPFGASLGRYIFVPAPMLSEKTVRHEYGHTMQGYKHGPFYLLLEGMTSFVRAAAATVFPALADGYYDQWPENEANELGGVR